MQKHYTYILSSKKNGTLYVGVTRDLITRIYQHKNKLIPGFSAKYNIDTLVHYEEFLLMMDAVAREKQLKSWNRSWKIQLIEQNNPQWADLALHF